MPAVQPAVLVRAVLEAFQLSGASGGLISSIGPHPKKFVVTEIEGMETEVWIYIWTLTRGGRAALAHEYRIQMTSVPSPLSLNPSGPTLLLGYEPERNMFAGFDLTKHRTFTSGSPSVQIDIRAVDEAMRNGFAFDRKNNDEIAIAFRPDQFISYLRLSDELHKYGKESVTFGILNRVTRLESTGESDISVLGVERRRIVSMVSRLSRLGSFRLEVLKAYGNSCAISRVQLQLVDAAHILPVGAPGSVDDVRNGIALSPTFHRAYDSGLIFLDQRFVMQINPARESSLSARGLSAGLEEIRTLLGRIHLPSDRLKWPNEALIKKANRFRQINT